MSSKFVMDIVKNRCQETGLNKDYILNNLSDKMLKNKYLNK